MRLIALLLHLLDERGRARLGDGTEVIDEVVASHTNTAILDGDSVGIRVVRDANFEVFFVSKSVCVRERKKADLVEGVSTVADELAKKNFLEV